jgi:hypothetical protein
LEIHCFRLCFHLPTYTVTIYLFAPPGGRPAREAADSAYLLN